MVTSKEIAALAGVSRGTVDRVLNHRGAVKPETEQRVREIARELNYQPNKAGMALAAQKKKISIGILLLGANSKNLFWEDVMDGVTYQQRNLSGYGCRILVKQSSFNDQEQIDIIDEFVKDGINGLIIAPCNTPKIARKIDELFEMGIPTATTNTDIQNSKRIFYVGSNYYESGRVAGGFMGLITGGSAKAGIVTGSSMVFCHTERIGGFINTISKRYPQIELLEIVENHDDELKSYHVTCQLLEKYPDMNALCFTAAGVRAGCQAVLDLKREKEMKIICFDVNNPVKELIRQGVISATICQQPFQQGSKPIKLLFNYLTTGIAPENPLIYTKSFIKIYENL